MSAKRKPTKAMPSRRLCEMKTKKILLAVTLALGAGQVFAYYSGNDLLEDARAAERVTAGQTQGTDAWKAGFWSGFIRGTSTTHDAIDPRVCLPTTSTAGQWGAVVRQYLEQNPAELHKPAQLLVREALQRAFPCR